MLFPMAPEQYDQAGYDILSKMEKFYAEALSINQSYWAESDIDTRFEAGDQTLWNDIYGNLPAHRRRQFNFNRIKRVVNMISGHQRRNRKSTIVIPVENADEETADQFTKIMMWIAQQEGMLETISESFHGALVTGMNLLQVWVDYRSDPISGNIKIDNCAYNSFLIDPYFRKADLSDCNGLWKRTYLTKSECISLMPDKQDDIIDLQPHDSNRDGKFQYLPENYNAGMRRLLTYDEFYYRSYRKQTVLVDSQTGETMEWKSENKDSLRQFLSVYPQVTVVENEIPTVNLAIIINGKVMYDGPNPCGIDTYPFVPVFAYYNPQMPYYPWRIQGVVRGLRDAQYLYNRRKVIELDILESQVNSGWIYKENALVNPKDVFQSGQGRGIALKQDAQMTDVQQIQSPAIPPSTIELSRALGEEINQISGVNEELLGSAIDDKAGILSMLRQGAGLTTLQSLFDNLDFAQKQLGKILISIIQNNFTPGKVKRIIEKDPTPQFYNKNYGKYDASVEEGLLTSNQRQMAMAQGLQLREIGIPIPDKFFIDNMIIQNKAELIRTMEEEKQAQQQQAQKAEQIQLQEIQSRANLADARVKEQEALANERNTRSVSNLALSEERRMESLKDLEQAKLEKLKQIVEIEKLDIDSLVALVGALKQIQQPIEHQLKEDIKRKPLASAPV